MSDLNVFKQPKPFYMIFFIELWERFGYYGLQALLALYFVHGLGLSESQSFKVFGAFSALVYGMVALGGYIGDKVLGTKRTMVLGAFTLTAGYTLMGAAGGQHDLVYLALGIIAVGNGLFKANPSSLLAKCYEEQDLRLHGAFTMYYMAINIGSFISMAFVPYLQASYGWSVGFYCCAVGLIIAILSYFLQRHYVLDIGSPPDLVPLKVKKMLMVLVGIVLFSFTARALLEHLALAQTTLILIGSGVLLVFAWEIIKSSGSERMRMIVALLLMFEAVVFFVLYMQMPTSLNFFAIKNVENSILGFAINPVSFQALNPFWIVIFSPLISMLYNYWGKRDKDLSMPSKFAVGMFFCALSFLILGFGTKFANGNGLVSSSWLILSYAFQSIGELLISGLGLAMVAELVPQKLHGFIMGAWFLTTASASFLAGHLASFTAPPGNVDAFTPIQTLSIYGSVFNKMGVVALVVAVLMLITAPYLSRLIRTEGS